MRPKVLISSGNFTELTESETSVLKISKSLQEPKSCKQLKFYFKNIKTQVPYSVNLIRALNERTTLGPHASNPLIIIAYCILHTSPCRLMQFINDVALKKHINTFHLHFAKNTLAYKLYTRYTYS
jgi:hypothetical protein